VGKGREGGERGSEGQSHKEEETEGGCRIEEEVQKPLAREGGLQCIFQDFEFGGVDRFSGSQHFLDNFY